MDHDNIFGSFYQQYPKLPGFHHFCEAVINAMIKNNNKNNNKIDWIKIREQ